MSGELPGWPDVEQILLEVLADLTSEQVVTDLPDDLQDVLPIQRVRRIGGAGDRLTDVARVDVEIYAATRAQGWPLAERQRQTLLAATRAPSGLIDRTEVEVGPHRMPYADPAVVLFQATYRVSVRRWSAAYALPS